MEILHLSSSAKNNIETLITVGVGVAAWETQTTAKFAGYSNNASGYGLFSKQRFGDAVAQTFGASAAKQVLPGWSGAADFTINPIGVINKLTVLGLGLLVLDNLLHGLPYYSKLSGFVEAAGWGLTIGGALGGFFDDTPGNGSIGGSPYTNTQVIQNPGLAQSINRSHGLGS